MAVLLPWADGWAEWDTAVPRSSILGCTLCLKFLVYQEAYAAWQRRMVHLFPHGIWDARLETLNSLF